MKKFIATFAALMFLAIAAAQTPIIVNGVPMIANGHLVQTVASSPLTFTNTSLPSATVGSVYLAFLQCTGGSGSGYQYFETPYPSANWHLWSDVNPVSGTVTGVPQNAETETKVYECVDSVGNTAQTSPLTLQINASGSLTVVSSPTMPGAFNGGAYSAPILIEGGVPPYYTYTNFQGYVSGSSGSTASLTVNSIPGTPFITGTGVSNATQFSGFFPGVSSQGIQSHSWISAQTSGTTGGAGSYTLNCSGTCTNSTGEPTAVPLYYETKPWEVTLDGWIIGTPTTTGTVNFGVNVVDSAGNTVTFNPSVTISNGLSLYGIDSPSGRLRFPTRGGAGQWWGYQPAAYGGTTPYTWSAVGLPSWASINSSTGLISGTPPGPGAWTVTITVTDSTTPTHLVTSGIGYLAVQNSGQVSRPSYVPSNVFFQYAGHMYDPNGWPMSCQGIDRNHPDANSWAGGVNGAQLGLNCQRIFPVSWDVPNNCSTCTWANTQSSALGILPIIGWGAANTGLFSGNLNNGQLTVTSTIWGALAQYNNIPALAFALGVANIDGAWANTSCGTNCWNLYYCNGGTYNHAGGCGSGTATAITSSCTGSSGANPCQGEFNADNGDNISGSSSIPDLIADVTTIAAMQPAYASQMGAMITNIANEWGGTVGSPNTTTVWKNVYAAVMNNGAPYCVASTSGNVITLCSSVTGSNPFANSYMVYINGSCGATAQVASVVSTDGTSGAYTVTVTPTVGTTIGTFSTGCGLVGGAIGILREVGYTNPFSVDTLALAEDQTSWSDGTAAAIVASDPEQNTFIAMHYYNASQMQVQITGITQATQAVISFTCNGTNPFTTLTNSSYRIVYGVSGMTQINGLVLPNVSSATCSGGTGSIKVNTNTTGFSAYTSGGTLYDYNSVQARMMLASQAIAGGLPLLIEEWGPPGDNNTFAGIVTFGSAGISWGVPWNYWAADDGSGWNSTCFCALQNGTFSRSAPSGVSPSGLSLYVNSRIGYPANAVPPNSLAP